MIIQSLCILGRQPALGLAELESLYGADKVRVAGDKAAVLDIDPCLLAFDRLGGSIKFCKVLTTLDTTNWHDIQKFLEQAAPEHAKAMPEGKMHLGLSAYGLKTSPKQVTASALSVKKTIQTATGRSVRVVPNQEVALGSAQVIHNHLTSPNGWELVFVRDGNQTICAQTIKEQNIADYTTRDRYRPKRDARVGMLPPKLAQIIINLAVGRLPEDKLQSICEIPADSKIPLPHFDETILDPFCGTGVVLQEAALMGYKIYGSDLEPRMIDYSKANLDWLSTTYHIQPVAPTLQTADATIHQWSEPVGAIASEVYLGRPFTSRPAQEVLAQTVADCNLITKKFLRNIHSQIKSGTQLCLAVPAWHMGAHQFKHLPLIDQIEELGYNRVSFKHVRSEDLVYHREGQIVGRELLVIIRK